MGVHLTDLVRKHQIKLEELQGRKLSIDAFNTLYQFLAIIRQRDGTPLMDAQGNVTSHYSGLFYRTIKLIEKGIKPVYVFDGKPPELKGKTIEARKSVRNAAFENWREAQKKGELEEARKHAQAAIKLNDEMIQGSKELLQAMGVPIVQAPSEGEAQAAVMCARGEVWAAGSQDFDSLLFGAPRLIRNLTITGRRKVPRKNTYVEIHPELLNLKEVLTELGITREKLIWLGLLVGTDFNDKIPGIGPKTALKLVKKHDSFNDILKETKAEINYDPQEIQDLFLNIDTTKDYKLEWKTPDRDKISEFLVEEHDFSPARVNNSLNTLEKSLKTTLSQGRLDSFFS